MSKRIINTAAACGSRQDAAIMAARVPHASNAGSSSNARYFIIVNDVSLALS
jgi:hypothetical protein